MRNERPGEGAGGEVERLDFASQVLPQLTKAGCNQGMCHGAAIGRGGLKLSLLGDDAASDYDALVREFGGRRVRLDSPRESLLLKKATGGLGHGGGVRLERGSKGYTVIESWLAAGAPLSKQVGRDVTRLLVTPSETIRGVGATVPLTVSALYTDGTTENVTTLALYDTLDDAVVQVDKAGVASIRASGIAAIMVRYRGQVAAARLGAPFPGKAAPQRTVVNPIDSALFSELARLNLSPAPRCDDATFLRRAHLDLIGTLPTSTEVRAFLAKPDRTKLVDALLSRPEFTDLWTLKLADLLRISGKRFGPEAAAGYHAWLRESVATNKPLNTLLTELLTQQESFWRTASDPRDLSEFFAKTWLGTRVECARCHNHPYDRWTRTDYHAFAATFGRPGQVPHPKTGKPLAARALGTNQALTTHTELATWASSSPRFAELLANRLWRELFGRGLVEPVDDLRPSNPAIHPRVLTALAQQLTRSGFDLRATLRQLTLSEAYQQSSKTSPPAPSPGHSFVAGKGGEVFAHALLKPLRAQVLADALASATGGSLGLPGRAIALADPEVASTTLDVLGRCRREGDCTPTSEAGGLAVALHLLAGAPLEKLVQGGAQKLLTAHPTDTALIEELFLRTLSRFPTAAERGYAEGLLKKNRPRAAEDLLWALVNTREFSYAL
ncbi:DUF1549 domain-containing protein [Armatimonas sp.]|uniref:DUF1549 domain-containing protein n=1 Tax=Armatimonas sp. TaxID=1872638 RepID=UPI00286B721D|nr:DUF1549 domain-containing protein [Armatimonas sp.]